LTAGNGSLMRLVPVVLAFRRSSGWAIHQAGQSSRTTHAAPTTVDGCRYFAWLLFGALEGRSKEELLSSFFYPSPDPEYWRRQPLSPEIAEIANGSFKQKEPPAIIGSGFVVRSLEAALRAFHRSDSFREGALRAVNLGDDADTTGAIYGQLAGAFYGSSAIPQDWIERLAMGEFIRDRADALFDFSTAWTRPVSRPKVARMKITYHFDYGTIVRGRSELVHLAIVFQATKQAIGLGQGSRRHSARCGFAKEVPGYLSAGTRFSAPALG
jgi:ADP-ribosyl-[dinitrogen reductase] hydrolase